VNVDIIKDNLDSAEFVGLIISPHLLVNKQNTSRNQDWTSPDKSQQEKYFSKIHTLIKSAVSKICKKFTWKNGNDLLCE